MTHLESLNLRYDQLDQELKALETRENKLFYRGENQKKLMLKKAFESFSHDEFLKKFNYFFGLFAPYLDLL